MPTPIDPAKAYEVPRKLMGPLAALYEHEAASLNTGGMIADLFDVSWTKEELSDILSEAGEEGASSEDLFDFLSETRRIVPLSEGRYRTDTCELVRLSSFNYDRFVKKDDVLAPTHVGATWSVERKEAPERELRVSEVKQLFQEEIINGNENGAPHGIHYDDPGDLLKAVEIVLNAWERTLPDVEVVALSRFQYRSMRDLLRGSKGSGKKTQVMRAGTGGGKSYGFQLGTLASLVYDRLSEEGRNLRVHTILMYPRVALVLDQSEGAIKIIKEINKLLPQDREIRYVTDAAERLKWEAYPRLVDNRIRKDKLKKTSIRTPIKEIYGSDVKVPHVIFCNPDTLVKRLWNPTAIKALSSTLRHVVFDEIHLLESITGANSAMVLRRLMAATQKPGDLMVTGATATVANPEGHVAKVFNRREEDVVRSEPDPETDEMFLSGIVNHVIHKPKDGQNFEGNLANLSSVVTHGRRRRLASETDNLTHHQKSIGFADSLQLLGAWNYLIRDLEGLQLTSATLRRLRKDGAITGPNPPGPVTNPHPYRFNRPLVNSVKAGLLEGVKESAAKEHCQNCVSGTQSTLPISNDDGFARIMIDPKKPRKNPLKYAWKTIWEPKGLDEIGITDMCPYFQMGLCWREEEEATQKPLFEEGPTTLSTSIRPLLLSSSTIRNLDSRATNPNQYFEEDIAGYYSFWDNTKLKDPDLRTKQHIAVSSPAMEVGVDVDNLTEAILFKAIRNIASYRQKVGRIGRERFRDTYAATLVSFRAIDYHYYRNPSPLLNEDRLDPIPLALDNENLRKQGCFHAIFDWLALSPDGESISSDLHSLSPPSGTNMRGVLANAKGRIELSGSEIQEYLKDNLGEADPSIRLDSIEAVLEILDIFLARYPFLFEDEVDKNGTKHPKECLADYLYGHAQWIETTQVGGRYATLCENVLEALRAVVDHGPIIRESEISDSENFVKGLISCLRNIEKGEPASDLNSWIDWFSQNYEKLLVFGVTNNAKSPGLSDSISSFLQLMQDWKSACEDTQVRELLVEGNIALGQSIKDIQQSSAARKRVNRWNYFENVARGIQQTRHRTPFVFPENLFEPPNLKKVTVVVPRRTSDAGGTEVTHDFEETSISEVLYSFAPGMWSYRKGGLPLKSKAYMSLSRTNSPDLFTLPLWGVREDSDGTGKHRFVEEGELDPEERPWGVPLLQNPDKIKIARPTQLVLMKSKGPSNGHRVKLATDPEGAIADGDDVEDTYEASEEASDDADSPINMPTCHAIQWRRVRERIPKPIKSYVGPFKDREFHTDPLISSLFDEVMFDGFAEVSEYTFGHSRKYTGMNGPDVMYVNNGRDKETAVLGHTFNTDAISFKINPELMSGLLGQIREGLKTPEWNAHQLNFFSHLMIEEFGLTRFQSEHIQRLIIWKHGPSVLGNPSNWTQTLSGITPEDIDNYTRKYLDIRPGNRDPDIGVVFEEKIQPMLSDFTSGKLDAEITNWALRTILNSLGITLLQTSRNLAGCRDEDIGYHVDMPRSCLEENLTEIRIWVYDRTPDGNGACKTVKNWFHIPTLIRQLSSIPGTPQQTILPSEDFVGTLQRFLRPCTACEGEAVAIAATLAGREIDIPPRYRDYHSIKGSYGEIWKELSEELKYPPQLHASATIMSDFITEDPTKSEMIRKSTARCMTSCPECLQEFGITSLGSLIGPIYANKRFLDLMTRVAFESSPGVFQKIETNLDSLGEALAPLGRLDLDADPLVVPSADGPIIIRPMTQTKNLWMEVDLDDPIDVSTGSINEYLWIQLDDSGWD